MICGPLVPNTFSGLRQLISQEAGRIEHGMRVLAEDLVFGAQGEVDALACDASGATVLLFVAAPESSHSLVPRVLAAQRWIKDNVAWLAEEVGDSGLRAELPPRMFVIGLEVLADTVEELRELGLPGLSVLQFCSFSLGSRQRLGVTALLDPQRDARALAATTTGGDPFRVPNGVVDPTNRAVAARFLDLLRKVDPRMTSTGDRFSRRLFLGGSMVAGLAMTDGRLFVSFPPTEEPGDEEPVELTHASCLSVVDMVLRAVLLLEVGPCLGLSEPVTDEADEESARPADAHDGHSTLAREGGAPVPDLAVQEVAGAALDDQERFSLEPIRRSVVQAQLSREEFSALGED